MKFALVMLCVVTACHAPAPTCPTTPAATAAPAQLAMRGYVLVLLRRGPAWTPEETPETKRIFEGHMANIHAMAEAGKLLVAGPFEAPDTDRSALAGLFLFDATKPDEVRPLLANDPAIAIGRLVPEFEIVELNLP